MFEISDLSEYQSHLKKLYKAAAERDLTTDETV